MKLFAPQNNWDMKSPESWWPLIGMIQTSAGVHISEESALSLSAFSCGVRVISETLASLPCNLLEQIDNRTTRKAVEQSLYKIVHDQPNAEQDSMTFFDSQVNLQVGWGNAYAEVERVGGEIVALWPIHPSRIPLRNIRRNGTDWNEIYAGKPGEIVFYVDNDDGTSYPLPASQVLLVPGVLSSNGITGKSVVHLGANALGIAKATEEHAGAFFKNGANPNFAIKSPKIVGKETAERLRSQWQSVFGGAKNHYKALILEDGMEAQVLTFSPEATQLILARQFSVTEISRLLRIPPHMLMDLSRATFSNIEAQGQELITYSLMPWIVRWEKALYRQLLTAEQQKRYRFKWNVNGLMRGDQAARSQFYKAGFDMGVFSPNDIRELEDLNPVDGGDQRFVPANNLVPLTLIGEMAEAQLEKTEAETERAKQPPPQPQPPAAPQPDKPDDAQAFRRELAQYHAEFLVAIEKRDDPSVAERLLERLDATAAGMSKEMVEAVRPMVESMREIADSSRNANEAMLAEQRTERAASELRITGLVEGSQAVIKETLEATREYADSLPPALEKAFSPLVESIQTQNESQNKQSLAILQAVNSIEIPPVQEPPQIDTSREEALAIRESELAKQRAAIEARLSAERETSRGVLCAAIRIRLDNLAEWESKALAKAADRPTEFKTWRERFYPRFVKQFAAQLSDLEPFASQIGVALDLPLFADRYSLASINDLKMLDEFAADNWHDRLKEGVDTLRKSLWTGRADALAKDMVEDGKRRFKESNHA